MSIERDHCHSSNHDSPPVRRDHAEPNADAMRGTDQGVIMSQTPTIGRIVLVRGLNQYGTPTDFPAIVTDVHSPQCVSVVVASAYAAKVNGVDFSTAQAFTSLLLNEEPQENQPRLGSWRWMPIQQQGGGFDARISRIEKAVAELAECRVPREAREPIPVPASQHSIFQPQLAVAAPGEPLGAVDLASLPVIKRAMEPFLAAVAEDVGRMSDKIVELLAKQAATDSQLRAAGMAVAALQAQLVALNQKQPERQRVDVKDPTPVVGTADEKPGAVAPVDGQTEH